MSINFSSPLYSEHNVLNFAKTSTEEKKKERAGIKLQTVLFLFLYIGRRAGRRFALNALMISAVVEVQSQHSQNLWASWRGGKKASWRRPVIKCLLVWFLEWFSLVGHQPEERQKTHIPLRGFRVRFRDIGVVFTGLIVGGHALNQVWCDLLDN